MKQLLYITVSVLFVLCAGCYKEIEVDRTELRIISLSPNLTEIMFALDLEDEIVGVTDFCRSPLEVQEKPRVGGLLDPNFEVMIRLMPTCVFGLPAHESLRVRFKEIGAELVIVENETIANVLDSILKIGELKIALGHFGVAGDNSVAQRWPD